MANLTVQSLDTSESHYFLGQNVVIDYAVNTALSSFDITNSSILQATLVRSGTSSAEASAVTSIPGEVNSFIFPVNEVTTGVMQMATGGISKGGQFTLTAEADAAADITETNEADNTSSTSINIYDAVEMSVHTIGHGGTNVQSGGTWNMSFTLKNAYQSLGQDLSDYGVRVVLSSNTIYTSGDYLLDDLKLSDFTYDPVNDWYRIDQAWDIPQSISGAYNVGLIYDLGNQYHEFNNDRTQTLETVAVAPETYDLGISNVSLNTTSAEDGDNIIVRYNITNNGTGDIVQSDNWKTKFELVKILGNTEIPIEIQTDDMLFDTPAGASLGPLTAGMLLSQGATPIAPGEYQFRVTLDSTDQIDETNESNNTFQTTFNVLPEGTRPPATGGSSDFDANGYDDILFFNESTRTVGQFEMPSGDWGGIGKAGAGWEAVGTGLFDNDDGSTDILWFNQSTGGVGRFDMLNGSVDRWDGIGFAGSGWDVMGAGDFNGDGIDDILWFNQSTGTVGQFRMIDTDPNWVSIGKTGAGWDVAGIGDFNGDGIDDILWENASTGKLGQFRMAADGKDWISGPTMGAGWSVAGTGDFYGGNDPEDILVFNESTRKIGYYDQFQLGGNDMIEWVSLGTAGAGWNIQGVGDFDASGTDDILWRHDDGRIGQFALAGENNGYDWDSIGIAGTAWDVML